MESLGRTFINNKDLGPHPTRASLLILPNPIGELLGFFASEANPSKGMNGHTTNIARGDT
jgi:hypothetical protein